MPLMARQVVTPVANHVLTGHKTPMSYVEHWGINQVSTAQKDVGSTVCLSVFLHEMYWRLHNNGRGIDRGMGRGTHSDLMEARGNGALLYLERGAVVNDLFSRKVKIVSQILSHH
jgi:hypothetical protein